MRGNTFAFHKTSPKLPLRPPLVKELAPWPPPVLVACAPLYPVDDAYLCTDGSIMKHSSSAFMNPSNESYLY